MVVPRPPWAGPVGIDVPAAAEHVPPGGIRRAGSGAVDRNPHSWGIEGVEPALAGNAGNVPYGTPDDNAVVGIVAGVVGIVAAAGKVVVAAGPGSTGRLECSGATPE